MKILLVAMKKSDATSYYRGAGVVADLENQTGAKIDITDWGGMVPTWDSLSRYDLFWFQRPAHQVAVTAANYIRKELGLPIWVDHDDDLLNLPATHDSVNTFAANREHIIGMIQRANAVTVSTVKIKESYSIYNENIHVVPNAVHDEMFNEFTGTRAEILFYRGMSSHRPELVSFMHHFRQLIADGHKLKFVTNINPRIYLGLKCDWIPEKELYMYFNYIRQLHPKAFMFPMVDNTFNRCRSNIAWLEATMAGSVCIAPDWPEWQKPGIIHCDKDNFYQVCKAVANGDYDIDALYRQSYEYIRENLVLSKVNQQRIEIIKSLTK
jgi:hypothetical protein